MNGENNGNDVQLGSKHIKWDQIGRASLIIGIPLLMFLLLIPMLPSIISKSDVQLIARIGIQSVDEEDSDSASVVLPQIEHLQHEEPIAEDETESTDTQNELSVNKVDLDTVMVYARVLVDGFPVDSVQVWAVACDASGNSFCPETALSRNDGSVDLGPIPTVIGPDSSIRISRIKVQACYHGGTRTIEESVVLRMDRPKTCVNIPVSINECLVLGLIFFASIIVAIIKVKRPWLQQAKYTISVILTLVMSAGVILVFVEGAKVVDRVEQETGSTSVSLGFVQMVKASYFPERSPDEWIVVVTAPEGGGALGFGAPLWVILVSVLGAVLSSVGIVIQELKSRAKGEEMDIQKEVHKLVNHQLYILFAPIGAIFIYQMMMLTGTAEENLTVGIAALAAGGGLGLLLKKASGTVTKFFNT